MITVNARVVVLDRDGVINVDIPGRYVCSADDWVPIDGSLEAMARLNAAGFAIHIVSNQSGIGRGLFTEDDLAAMHAKLVRMLAEYGGEVAGWFYCPIHPQRTVHAGSRLPGCWNRWRRLPARVSSVSRSSVTSGQICRPLARCRCVICSSVPVTVE